jgi:hypothetical protein
MQAKCVWKTKRVWMSEVLFKITLAYNSILDKPGVKFDAATANDHYWTQL